MHVHPTAAAALCIFHPLGEAGGERWDGEADEAANADLKSACKHVDLVYARTTQGERGGRTNESNPEEGEGGYGVCVC